MGNKKPTAKEYQYERAMCILEHYNCSDCFEPIDPNGRRCCCSNCSIAIEHKNKKECRK